MDILLLTTPPQHSTSNDAVILDAKNLRSWLEKLPIMNVIDTVGLLQNAITAFNELQLEKSERIKLLDIYHYAFEEILFSYDDLRLRSLPITPEQRKNISEDIMWLYLGLANGYKVIVKEGHDSGLSPKRDSTLLVSIYRAMELILNAVAHAYMAHGQTPPLAFLEIKQLYLYAKHHNVHDKRIKTVKGSSFPPTISNIFKHFCLFNTLNPEKYESSDILELFMLLESFTPDIQVEPALSAEHGDNQFLINLEDDEPMEKVKDFSSEINSTHVEIINIQPTFDAIQERLNLDREKNVSLIEKKEQQLLAEFLTENQQCTQMQDIHTAESRNIKIITNFNAITKLVNQKDQLSSIFDIENINGIEVSNLDEEIATSISNWQLIDEVDMIKVLVGKSQSDEQELKLGNITGLIESSGSNNPTLLIGVIGKIKNEDEQPAKMGVQVIPGSPSSISLSTKELTRQGLYFPAINALNLPASVLLERNNLNKQGTFNVIINSQQLDIELDSIILETAHYIQYSFKVVS